MLFHITETLEQIVSHVNIFQVTGTEVKDKNTKVKSVPNPILVFDKLREKYEQQKSDTKSTSKSVIRNNQTMQENERNNEKRGHYITITDYMETMADSRAEKTMCEKVLEMLDTIDWQNGINQ